MKKIFLFFAAFAMTAGVLSAQDINQATESYNNGAMELQMGNNGAALENFLTALTMGEALGDEGADLVANCKKAICSVKLSMAKDLYNAKDFENAAATFQKAQELAESYGEAEIAAEAGELVNQANIRKIKQRIATISAPSPIAYIQKRRAYTSVTSRSNQKSSSHISTSSDIPISTVHISFGEYFARLYSSVI